MKKRILLSCFAAMTAATSIQAELPLMARIHRNLETTQQRIQRDPAFALTPKSCSDCITMGNLCPDLRTKYPYLYKRVDAIVAQNGICTRCKNMLKTLAQKGGAPVARFISAGLDTIKNNPKKTIALAAVTLPALVYGAAQLCVTYGTTATLAQPMSAATDTAHFAQTIIDAYDGYIFSPVSHAAATACNWTMQTATGAAATAGQKLSAAGSYVSSAMSSFWNSTKALTHDMWNHHAIAGDLKAEQALFNATHQTASLNPTTFAPVRSLGPDCNVTSIDEYITASHTCATAHDAFADAEKVLAATRDYNNQPTWFGGRLWRSLWAPDTTQQILDANAKVQAATRTMNTECAQVATTCDATILDEYVKAKRACAKALGTISQAEEALKAANDYNNQPASWKNLYGLWKTAYGPSAVQQIRETQLGVRTAKQAALTACRQANTANNAVNAMMTQVAAAHAANQAAAAQATMTRTAQVIEGLKTRLGKVNFARSMMGLGTLATAALGACGIAGIAAKTGIDTVGVIAKSDKLARFKNWCSRTLCCSKASAQ